jgi:hypothetical protein
MPILAHLGAALDDPESWAGLFAAANTDELAAIADVVASYAPEKAAQGDAGLDEAALPRERLAAGAAGLATKALGQPEPVALARWAARRLGARPEMPDAIGGVDAWLISLLASQAGPHGANEPERAALIAALPDTRSQHNEPEARALRLAVEAACLRRAKRTRLVRVSRWLGLRGLAAPPELPDPATIRGVGEPESESPRWRELWEAAGKVPLDM